jgi:hypothetical protein
MGEPLKGMTTFLIISARRNRPTVRHKALTALKWLRGLDTPITRQWAVLLIALAVLLPFAIF